MTKINNKKLKVYTSNIVNVNHYFKNLNYSIIRLLYIESLGYILIYDNEYNNYCYSIESGIVPTTLETNWDYDNPVIRAISEKIEWIFKDYINEKINENKGDTKKVIKSIIDNEIDKLLQDLSKRYEVKEPTRQKDIVNPYIKEIIKNPKKQFKFYLFQNKPSIYAIPKDLKDKGYEFDDNNLYCPLNTKPKYYIGISRGENQYLYSIARFNKENNSFIKKTKEHSGKQPINIDNKERNNFFHIQISRINKKQKKDIFNKEALEEDLNEIAIDIGNIQDFPQINKEFTVYKKLKNSEEDNVEVEQIDMIEWRRNPTFDKEIAEKVKSRISNYGFITYLENILNNVHLGDKRNIYRKILSAFNIMRGESSYLIKTTSESGTGKSKEDETVFLTIIPKEYMFKKNHMTLASFTRYDTEYFDRQIVYFGDLGNKKAFDKINDVFDVFKVLITEGEYSRDITEKSEKGNYEITSLNLKVKSIGGVFSTTKSDFYESDSQLESRTIECKTANVQKDDLLDFIGDNENEISPERRAYEKGVEDLKEFQDYLLSLVTFNKIIVNPYISVFKRYATDTGSDVETREFKQLLTLFKAYCILTNYNCIEYENYLICSTKQLKEFFRYIALPNSLIPIQSDFINMLMAKGTKKELTLINHKTENKNNPEEPLDDLNTYLNNVIEDMENNQTNLDDYTTFDELTGQEETKAIKKLLSKYRLGGRAKNHETHVFFTIQDIKAVYGNYSAYKNIDNVSHLLNDLYKKGYMDKLEVKDKNTGQNIYYLTVKCKTLNNEYEFTKNDKEETNKRLKKYKINIKI